MTDLPVLTAGQTREIVLDGTRYTVRALTHGEHAALQLALAAQRVPSTELINDTLRRAAEAAGRPDLAEALTAEEEASDALQVFLAGSPPGLDDVGLAEWHAENAAELRRLRAAVLAAGRRARLAREMFGADPAAAELTARASRAVYASNQEMVAAGLAAIDGVPVSLGPDYVARLPSGHVHALSEAISRLLSPGRDAAKN